MGNAVFLAHPGQGLRDGGIGVFRKENPLCASILQGFSQLFCTYDDPFFPDIRKRPALPYSTIFFSIHTKHYYTQFSRNVNRKFKIFSDFLRDFLPVEALPTQINIILFFFYFSKDFRKLYPAFS